MRTAFYALEKGFSEPLKHGWAQYTHIFGHKVKRVFSFMQIIREIIFLKKNHLIGAKSYNSKDSRPAY